ncbi:hypothetical protein WMY93_010251 [Mugilogobius chulae]|uniref:Uncharacterized protein n=1 Tax=Mugilogobius chulae TaxID=88201 RepID=A0AAW0P6N2_9GOBI
MSARRQGPEHNSLRGPWLAHTLIHTHTQGPLLRAAGGVTLKATTTRLELQMARIKRYVDCRMTAGDTRRAGLDVFCGRTKKRASGGPPRTHGKNKLYTEIQPPTDLRYTDFLKHMWQQMVVHSSGSLQFTVEHTPLLFDRENAPVTEAECEGPCFGMRRSQAANGEALREGPRASVKGAQSQRISCNVKLCSPRQAERDSTHTTYVLPHT